MLLSQTPKEWLKTALQDFDAFLIDHAACERKASAIGLSFVVRYPDRPEILEPMVRFAREELEHFHQVIRLLVQRGLTPAADEEDAYVKKLTHAARTGRDERFLDRLLIAGLIEARGHERLEMVAAAIEDPTLKNFYTKLSSAESRHRDFFIDMAKLYFDEETITKRLHELAQAEKRAIESVPHRSALH